MATLIEQSPRGGCAVRKFDFTKFSPPNGRVTPTDNTVLSRPITETQKSIEGTHAVSCYVMSEDGALMAMCDKHATHVIDLRTNTTIHSLPIRRTVEMLFSPDNSILATWEPYVLYASDQQTTTDGAQKKPDPNMRLWNVRTGEMVKILTSRNRSTWKPQWSKDSQVCLRSEGSEVFHSDKYFKQIGKFTMKHLCSVSMSPSTQSYYMATATSCNKGTPGYLRVHQIADDSSYPALCQKTFMNADRAEFTWSPKGDRVLALLSVEVDASNQSYYGGKQRLILLSRASEHYKVHLAKDGPIFSLAWHPNGDRFCVVYGYMPAKTTIFDTKAQIVCEIQEGPRNGCSYNATGNLLLLTGFGNLAGSMEFYTQETKQDEERLRLVCYMKVPDTTQHAWAPDGQHIVTATCTPRLRLNNGYRIWKYTGECVYENLIPDRDGPKPGEKIAGELWSVAWRPDKSASKPFEVGFLSKAQRDCAGLDSSGKTVASLRSEHPAGVLEAAKTVKAGAYVPPHLRGKDATAPKSTGSSSANGPPKVEKSEDEKQLAKAVKKLRDIRKIQEKADNGVKLELNQLEKLKSLAAIEQEIAELKIKCT